MILVQETQNYDFEQFNPDKLHDSSIPSHRVKLAHEHQEDSEEEEHDAEDDFDEDHF